MPVETQRPKFIVDLLSEVDGFDETLFPAGHQIGANDTVVGEASPWCQKAWALMRMYARELKQLKLEIEFDSTQKDQHAQRYDEIDHKVDTLKEILWGSIREEFRLWTAEAIGIRANWKVVTTKNDGEETFKRFLGGILGHLE